MRLLSWLIVTSWGWGCACAMVGALILFAGLELGKVLLVIACGFAGIAAVFIVCLGLLEAAGTWQRRRRI